MKLIHVTGYSDTGKTTFIQRLLKELSGMGKTAVVKHTGHHTIQLDEGKDTTTHFEHGAAFSIGIDSEKAVGAIHSTDLNEILTMLCDAGVEYTIIEGFKKYQFPKIVMGDFEAENCILKNPQVDEVISSLESFEDYFTMQGVICELKRENEIRHAGAILSFNGIVREITDDKQTEYMDFDDYDGIDEKISEIKAEMEKVPGIIGVKFHHQKGRLYAGEDITYIAILAAHRQEAFVAMSAAIDKLKKDLHNAGKELLEE